VKIHFTRVDYVGYFAEESPHHIALVYEAGTNGELTLCCIDSGLLVRRIYLALVKDERLLGLSAEDYHSIVTCL